MAHYIYYAIFLVSILIIYLISFLKNIEKTLSALKIAIDHLKKGLPIIFAAMLITGVLYVLIKPDFIKLYLSESSLITGILIATLLGYLFPGPRYIIYPVAKFLLLKGAAISVVLVLIFSQQLIDVPDGMFIEIKMLGWRFFIIRLIVATAVCIIAGLLGELILRAIGV